MKKEDCFAQEEMVDFKCLSLLAQHDFKEEEDMLTQDLYDFACDDLVCAVGEMYEALKIKYPHFSHEKIVNHIKQEINKNKL